MRYTHDKHGRPLTPALCAVLNDMAIPVPPRYRKSAPPPQDSDVSLLEKTPAVKRPRRIPVARQECLEHPLGRHDLFESVSVLPEENSPSLTKEPSDSEDSEVADEDLSRSRPPRLLQWVLSFVAPEPKGEAKSDSNSDDKNDIKTGSQEKSDFRNFLRRRKQHGGPHPRLDEAHEAPEIRPLETYRVCETPMLERPHMWRVNSDYYRILAIEITMCQHGKLEHPLVPVAIAPRRHSGAPGAVLGILPHLSKARARQWRELSAKDFDSDSDSG